MKKTTTAPQQKPITLERKKSIAKAIKIINSVQVSEWAYLFNITRRTLNNWEKEGEK